MGRKRLTAATLQDLEVRTAAEQAADLSLKLLGKAATDRELITAGRLLHRSLGPAKVAALWGQTKRVAQESGERFPIDDDGSQPDPRETQAYVGEHEITPDHAVLDVVLHEQDPTQNPTAGKKPSDKKKAPSAKKPVAAAEEDETEEEEEQTPPKKDKKKAAAEVVAEGDEDEAEPEVVAEGDEDEAEPEVEEPSEVEEDDEDFVDDESEEDADDEDLDLEEDEEDEEDEESGQADHGTSRDDESEDYYEEEGADDGKFSMEDMENLEKLGLDFGEDGPTKSEPASASGKKAGKKAAAKPSSFRPSRTRMASPDSNQNEFDLVFNVPDIGTQLDD